MTLPHPTLYLEMLHPKTLCPKMFYSAIVFPTTSAAPVDPLHPTG